MDRSAVKAIVDREIDGLLDNLGIAHWVIRVAYEPSPTSADGVDSRGECVRLVDYNSACVTLNPEAFDDEGQLLKTLRHELFHVVLSPFDVARNLVEKALETNPVRLAMVESVWTHATEKSVINLERMHFCMTRAAGKAAPGPERKPKPKPRSKRKR